MATGEEERLQRKIQRGEQIAAWLKRISKNPITGAYAKPLDISNASGISYNRINKILYHNCREKDGTVNLPEEPTIVAIANAYKVDPDEARAIVGLMPEKMTDKFFIVPDGMRRDDLSTGHILFTPETDPRKELRAYLVEAYIRGQMDTDAKKSG